MKARSGLTLLRVKQPQEENPNGNVCKWCNSGHSVCGQRGENTDRLNERVQIQRPGVDMWGLIGRMR